MSICRQTQKTTSVTFGANQGRFRIFTSGMFSSARRAGSNRFLGKSLDKSVRKPFPIFQL